MGIYHIHTIFNYTSMQTWPVLETKTIISKEVTSFVKS